METIYNKNNYTKVECEYKIILFTKIKTYPEQKKIFGGIKEKENKFLIFDFEENAEQFGVHFPSIIMHEEGLEKTLSFFCEIYKEKGFGHSGEILFIKPYVKIFYYEDYEITFFETDEELNDFLKQYIIYT